MGVKRPVYGLRVGVKSHCLELKMNTVKAQYKSSTAHALLNLLVITFILKHNQVKKKTENISPFSSPYALKASQAARVSI